ncbi:membrane protein [Pseudomonas aeruginosa]|nr:membrane protein [Pseudomonas aeruginosa]
MKTLVDHLAQYAAYHRDRRNIFSHFIGIPMIVLSIAVLLARPALGFGLSPALLLALAAALFYLRLDLRFGVAMTALLALTVWGAAQLAAGTTAAWLGWGVGLFVVGWIIQFVGHYYEGRKPAFVDDLSGVDRRSALRAGGTGLSAGGCAATCSARSRSAPARPAFASTSGRREAVSRERGRPGWERYLRSAAMRWRM